ncbi:MAG: Tetratricopeptide repeat protein [candidate division WS2 bacterium ADurb.Bin280]|uniref:Tetratricopeptide repeat protein n=1 Tax=candidate division WS2 bacterium ADurb.Bin280 TaxID=1852829 RepID=A0A1V5SGQ1_9BACT|nr:MAG: Tetratricopeptide repeat protein [candidate division WS2 bacterium ADurb.Bin280]
MKERISSYKLSAQLKAEIGVSRWKNRSLDIPFSLPSFSKLGTTKEKIPYKKISVALGVFALIISAYIGVMKTYEFAKLKSAKAQEQKLQAYNDYVDNLRSEIEKEATDAYSFQALSQKYIKEGNGEKALAAAQMAVQKDPIWRDGFLNLGHVYMTLNQFEKAKDALQSALERDPTCGQAHYFMYLVLDELNEKTLAKEEYAKANIFGFETQYGG